MDSNGSTLMYVFFESALLKIRERQPKVPSCDWNHRNMELDANPIIILPR